MAHGDNVTHGDRLPISREFPAGSPEDAHCSLDALPRGAEWHSASSLLPPSYRVADCKSAQLSHDPPRRGADPSLSGRPEFVLLPAMSQRLPLLLLAVIFRLPPGRLLYLHDAPKMNGLFIDVAPAK